MSTDVFVKDLSIKIGADEAEVLRLAVALGAVWHAAPQGGGAQAAVVGMDSATKIELLALVGSEFHISTSQTLNELIKLKVDVINVDVDGFRKHLDRLRLHFVKNSPTPTRFPRKNYETKKKIRVSDLAKELGLSNREALDLSKSMGIDVRSFSSSMLEAQADRVRRKAERDGLIRDRQPPETKAKKIPPAATITKHRKRERWPLPAAYDDAVFDATHAFTSHDLRTMQVEPRGVMGESSIYQTGGFACVAKAKIDDSMWAVRLLYRHQEDLEDRYRAIHDRQRNGGLSQSMVPVDYREDEITVRGFNERFPVILLRWVDGVSLNAYVREACHVTDTRALELLLAAMNDLENSMRGDQIAHRDLSGDNIVVVKENNNISLKLVDYDSVWLPEIAHLRSSVGDGDLQHPGMLRSREHSSGLMADYFAFRLYELGLKTLIKLPEHGKKIENFEYKFLVTRQEILDGNDEIVQSMRSVSPDDFDHLVKVLQTDYDELFEVAHTGRQPVLISGDLHRDLISLAEIVMRLDIPVADARLKCARYGLDALVVEAGIPVSMIPEIFGPDLVRVVFGIELPEPSSNKSEELDWTKVKDLKVTMSFFESVLADVLGKSVQIARTISLRQSDLDAGVSRVLDEREKYPIPAQTISEETNSSGSEISEILKKIDGGWIYRPYGTFLSVDAANRVRSEIKRRIIEDASNQTMLNKIAVEMGLSIIEVMEFAQEFSYDVEAKRINHSEVTELKKKIENVISRFPFRFVEVASELGVTKASIHSLVHIWPSDVLLTPSGGRMTFDCRRRLHDEFRVRDSSDGVPIASLAKSLHVSEDRIRAIAREIVQCPPETKVLSEWVARQIRARMNG
jgi:serine/threonine protein kinase